MKEIELFENERADNYDDFVLTWIPQYQFVMNLLPVILNDANNTGNKELLVAGCGTGNEILTFKRAGLEWSITGVDPSPDMIMQAKKKVANHQNIELICGLVSDLASDKLYGAATLVLVLHFFPDDGSKQSLLEDISSRLEAGAPFVLMDIFGSGTEIRHNLNIFRKTLPASLTPEEISERIERIEQHIHYIPEERLIDLLTNAGFEKPVRFHQSTIYGGWITKKV